MAEPSLSYKRLTETVGGMTYCPTCLFTLQAAQGRSLEKTRECPIEYAFDKMSNDCLRNGILFGTTTTRSGLNVWTEGRTCHVSIGGVPYESRVACHMYA